MTYKDTYEHSRLRLEALKLAVTYGYQQTTTTYTTSIGVSSGDGSVLTTAHNFYNFLSKDLREAEEARKDEPAEDTTACADDSGLKQESRIPRTKYTPASEDEIREVLAKAAEKAKAAYRDPVTRQLIVDGSKTLRRWLK